MRSTVTNFKKKIGKNSTRLLLILFVGLVLTACKLEPLQIDPCAVIPEAMWPANIPTCHAVPLNQPDKPEYDRSVIGSDICVTADDYAKLQKFTREVLRRCGDRCQ